MKIEQSIQITSPSGLHARPAVKLAQIAARFNANVQLRLDDSSPWIKARSVAKIMKLKAANNTVIYFRADGEQAAEAISALIDFVKRDFDEGPAPQSVADSAGTAVNFVETIPTPQPDEVISDAITAAEGLAEGILYRLTSPVLKTLTKGTVEQEQQALQVALDQALNELNVLAQQTHHTISDDAMAADIIAFQQQLLTDPELLDPVKLAIDQTSSAIEAWCQILDNEIDDYRNADNEYFQGRATDLRDLRDRVLGLLSGQRTALTDIPEGAILFSDELTPSQFLEIDWTRCRGAVTRFGSFTGHVAMLARAHKVPLLIQLEFEPDALTPPIEVILIAARDQGRLIVNPAPETRTWYQQQQQQRQQREQALRHYLTRPAQTADGSPISVYINVDDPLVLDSVDPNHCDGIGLTRTEFLFYNNPQLPDEDQQYQIYRRLLEWAQGHPVTIRTLDAGGDKPIPGVTFADEGNPFLGVRGLRLSLLKPDVFQIQLRALARAAVHGPLKVLLPMVTLATEFEQARSLLQQTVADLQTAAVEATMPSLGMMVEVPAAALTIANFNADFFSIGSNDLTQYTMAAGRDCADLAHLQNANHPALLELIQRVAQHGARIGIEVSLCGEMAAVPEYLPRLLDCGVNTLSVPPTALAVIKAELARIECQRQS